MNKSNVMVMMSAPFEKSLLPVWPRWIPKNGTVNLYSFPGRTLPLDFDPVYCKYLEMLKECQDCELKATHMAMAGIGLVYCGQEYCRNEYVDINSASCCQDCHDAITCHDCGCWNGCPACGDDHDTKVYFCEECRPMVFVIGATIGYHCVKDAMAFSTFVTIVMSTYAVITRKHIPAKNVKMLFAAGSAKIRTIAGTMACIGKYKIANFNQPIGVCIKLPFYSNALCQWKMAHAACYYPGTLLMTHLFSLGLIMQNWITALLYIYMHFSCFPLFTAKLLIRTKLLIKHHFLKISPR